MFMPEKIKTAVSPENIIYNLEFEEALKENNLLDFDSVMSITETRNSKVCHSRTKRLELFLLNMKVKQFVLI